MNQLDTMMFPQVISASFRNAMINVGRTEASQTQNPTWDGLFRMQYKFEEKQTLCFKVFYKSPGNEVQELRIY